MFAAVKFEVTFDFNILKSRFHLQSCGFVIWKTTKFRRIILNLFVMEEKL